MCIYCGTTKYRKIYENHYGPIPKDKDGKSYDIHHIDGDRRNNNPTNLKCVTIQEHYDIHYSQGDYGACWLISGKMQMPRDKVSELAKKNAQRQVANGTHPFLGGEVQRKQLLNGTHPFLDKNAARARAVKRVEEGKHHLLSGEIQRRYANKRVAEGTHHLLGGEVQRQQLATGTHPSQLKKTCEHCGKCCGAGQFGRWHGDNCKARK